MLFPSFEPRFDVKYFHATFNMVTQQLLDYVQGELRRGISKDQIKQTLLANDWQAIDIDEALNGKKISTETQSSPKKPKGPVFIKTMISLTLLVALGAGAYFAYCRVSQKSDKNPEQSIENTQQSLNNTPEEKPNTVFVPSDQKNTESPSSQVSTSSSISEKGPVVLSKNENMLFADKLEDCTPYKMTYFHPITSAPLTKEITGSSGGKCGYSEQLPSGGNLECKYSESERKVIADYLRDLAAIKFVSSTKKQADPTLKLKYTFDGKIVNNPIQEALRAGVCSVSGF